MGKYEQDARLLLEYVGGKENIAAVSHCVSRMRFVLNDPAKADVAKIEALKSAKGTFTQAGCPNIILNPISVNGFTKCPHVKSIPFIISPFGFLILQRKRKIARKSK